MNSWDSSGNTNKAGVILDNAASEQCEGVRYGRVLSLSPAYYGHSDGLARSSGQPLVSHGPVSARTAHRACDKFHGFYELSLQAASSSVGQCLWMS